MIGNIDLSKNKILVQYLYGTNESVASYEQSPLDIEFIFFGIILIVNRKSFSEHATIFFLLSTFLGTYLKIKIIGAL
jgi:hypothetical protein